VIGPKAISKTIPVIASGLPFALVADNITGHGQDVEISEPFVDIKTKSLTMKVSSHDGGNSTLRIPRNLLDAKDTNANDIALKVSIDGKSVSYQEEKIKSPNTAINGAGGYREMTFFVPKDSKALEVVGTKTISLMVSNAHAAGKMAIQNESGMSGMTMPNNMKMKNMIERGNIAMGFNQNKIMHHFIATTTGAEIMIVALNSSDSDTTKQIRNRVADIQKEFSEGNFTKPFFIHAQQVPGTKLMTEKKT
jgi:hypothetical protein